ncbi:MAG TPA: PEP-CTERM sorting domain-containing protein [Gemmataceae bacterium]|nr:PEP-CTERM sorting domain-containing protein [Gemmataceae bacterium]
MIRLKVITGLITGWLAFALAPTAQAGIIVPSDLKPGDKYQLIFVTSFLSGVSSANAVPPPDYPDFGGLAAADWVVTSAASDAGLIDNWDGETLLWKALLSIAGQNAVDRIPITGPVYNLAGQRLANNSADLWDGSLAAPVRYTEYGIAISGNTHVWTGTNTAGNANGLDLGGWLNPGAPVGLVGDATFADSRWLGNSNLAGTQTAHLYAISPEFEVPDVAPEPASLVLLGIGVMGMVAYHRRGRKLPRT